MCLVGWIKTFFPVCLPWVTACSIYGMCGHTRSSASGSKGQRKKKNRQNPVKAPYWHKHKRNGPCVISLNKLFRREAKPFSPLMRQSAHVRSKSFWAMVCWRIKSLLRKNLCEKKKTGDSFLNLPFYCYFCIRRVLWRLRNAQKNNAVDN